MKTGTDQSVILVLFDGIEKALSSLIGQKVIYSIEIYNEQERNELRERPRKYPYIGIEINIVWDAIQAFNSHSTVDNIIQNIQNGLATIVIHLIYNSLNDETVTFKEMESVRFKIHRAIHLINNEDYYTHLMRINTGQDTSHERISDFPMTYECEVTEAALLGDRSAVSETDVEMDGHLV